MVGWGCGTISGGPTLTQDPRAVDLLGRDPLALLLCMLFNRQFPRKRLTSPTALVSCCGGEDRLAPRRFRCALAGRDQEGLEALRDRAGDRSVREFCQDRRESRFVEMAGREMSGIGVE